MGFAYFLSITCKQCDFQKEFYSSQPVEQSFDINRRIIYAMRSIGQGQFNRKRLFRSVYKSSDRVRKRRKILRGAVKSGIDINEETEGKIYEAGGFV